MEKKYRVAVVGATGLVGKEMIAILSERGFPVSELVPLASTKSAGQCIDFNGEQIKVQIAHGDSFKNIDIALFSAGGAASKILAPAAAEAGAIVIDNSSQWRMTKDIPLVVPEVNAHAIANYTKKRIIANPNCSTIQMVVALAPLHQEAALTKVIVSTYQAVSGAGKDGIDELSHQVTSLFNQQDFEPKQFSKQIAFNCIPHIDVFLDNNYSKEEQKMIDETRKILEIPTLSIVPTCVRVPVFNGHAESVYAEFSHEISAEHAKKTLREAKGILLQDDPQNNVYPLQIESCGQDITYVGRIRQDQNSTKALAFWCVADNLRKGAATNAVQIAEILVRDYLNKK